MCMIFKGNVDFSFFSTPYFARQSLKGNPWRHPAWTGGFDQHHFASHTALQKKIHLIFPREIRDETLGQQSHVLG